MRMETRRFVAGLLAALFAALPASPSRAQVNPVYSQDPVTGNATQQQKVTVPAGQTWTCLGTCTGGTAGSVAVANITGLGTGVAAALTAATNAALGLPVFDSSGNLSLAGNLTVNGGTGVTGSNLITAGKVVLSSAWALASGGGTGLMVLQNGGGTAQDVFDFSVQDTIKLRNHLNTGDANVTFATQSPGTNNTTGATTGFVAAAIAAGGINLAPTTLSSTANTALNNTTYTDVQNLTLAQGSTGTWFVSGTVVGSDSTGGVQIKCKLWDGTTVIASADITTTGAGNVSPISLSGRLATPAAGLRISCLTTNTGAGSTIMFNASGNSKDATITAFRVQ